MGIHGGRKERELNPETGRYYRQATSYDEKTKLHYRTDAGELHIIRTLGQYNGFDVKGRVVLDVGANIGSFSRWALDHGAKHVHGYEPSPDTFEILKKNKVADMTITHAAILGDRKPTIPLYLSHTMPADNTIRPRRGRQAVEVPARCFWDELSKNKPSAVKLDAEGVEYDIMVKPFPKYVEEFAVEIHIGNPKKIALTKQLLSHFLDWNVQKRFRLDWRMTTVIISRKRLGLGSLGKYLETVPSW